MSNINSKMVTNRPSRSRSVVNKSRKTSVVRKRSVSVKRKNPIRANSQQAVLNSRTGQAPISRPDTTAAMKYQHCRLNPFTTNGSEGLPDNSSTRRIVKDVRVAYNVVVGSSGGFMFFMIPELPRGIMFKDVVQNPVAPLLSVNGIALAGALQGPDIAGGWYAPVIPEWGEWARTTGPNSKLAFNPWGAAKARLITQAVRLSYVGKVVDCAGWITTYPVAAAVEDDQTTNQLALNSYYNGGGLATTYAVNTAAVRLNIMTSSPAILSPGCVQTTVPQGGYVVNRKSSSANNWQSLASPFAIAEFGLTATLAETSNTTSVSAFYDSNWESPMVAVQGMVVGTTMRVEMALCFELEPIANSPLRDYARLPTPISEAQLVKPEKILSSAPIMGPYDYGETLIGALKYAPTVIKTISEVAALF